MDRVLNLITKVKDNKDEIVYINISDEDEYLGWVKDFGLKFSNGQTMSLDLCKEEDLFYSLFWHPHGVKLVPGKMQHISYRILNMKAKQNEIIGYYLKMWKKK